MKHFLLGLLLASLAGAAPPGGMDINGARREVAAAQVAMSSAGWQTTCLLRKAGGISARGNEGYLILEGRSARVVIDKSSGLAVQITSLDPAPLDILPPTSNGLAAYLWNKEDGWVVLAKAVEPVQVAGGRDEFGRYLAAETVLRYGDTGLADIAVSYRMYADMFRVVAEVRYDRPLGRICELGFTQVTDNRQWERQLYPQGICDRTHILSATERFRERYFHQRWDATGFIAKASIPGSTRTIELHEDAGIDAIGLPHGVLEAADRFVVWGYLDINSFVVLAPNRYGGIVQLMITPYGFKQGGSYTFDFIYKTLPKTEYKFVDVCRWYAENLYSSNPVTAGIVRLPKDLKPRTLPQSRLGGSNNALPGDPAFEQQIDDLIRTDCRLVWDGWGTPFTEDFPTDHPFYDYSDKLWTPEEFRGFFAQLKSRGLYPYMYVRQLYPNIAFGQGQPWHHEWMLSTSPGTVFSCPWASVPLEELDAESYYGRKPNGQIPLVKLKGNGDDIPSRIAGRRIYGYAHVRADFGIKAMRDTFAARVEKAIDYYQPSGLAYDMGWNIDTCTSLTAPETDQFQGITAAMHDIYVHKQKTHPEQRFIMNGSGSPAQLWVDAVMYEAGPPYTRWDVDRTRIYRTPITTYYGEWPVRAIMESLGVGVSWGAGYRRSGSQQEMPALSYPELSEFCALANTLPMVIEGYAVNFSPDDPEQFNTTVWTDKDHLILAAFNSKSEPLPITITLDRHALRTIYHQSGCIEHTFTVLNAEGHPRADASFQSTLTDEQIAITGTLGAGEMVLMQ